MKKNLKLFYVIGVLWFMTKTVHAQPAEFDSWNQYRGHARDGVVAIENTPKQWPTEGLKELWSMKVGESFSEIAIADGRAFVTSSELIDSTSGFEHLLALDAQTGKQLWKVTIDSLFIDVDKWGNGPRATPTVDGEMVYILSGLGKFSAYDTKTGKRLFQHDFGADYGSKTPRWGYSTSALRVEDMMVIEIGGTENRALGAFDKKAGELLWANGQGAAHYGSPIQVEMDGQKQIVYASGKTLYSFNYKGDTLWTCNLPVTSPTAAPVFIKPNRFFISAVRRIGFCVIEVEDNKAKVISEGTSMKTDYSTACYHNGYIYGFNVATLQCINPLTGEKIWTKRGFGKGSLIIVGDKLVILSDAGKLVYAEATPESFVELSSFQALEGRCWTAPSLAGGRLYVRNLDTVSCYSFSE